MSLLRNHQAEQILSDIKKDNCFATEVMNSYEAKQKNKTRLSKILNIFILSIILFLMVPIAACGKDKDEPPTEPKLPFGVFPLNDVSWEHGRSIHVNAGPGERPVYDDTGKLIGTIMYWSGKATITYSVKQVGENRAELYVADEVTWRREVKMYGKEVVWDDTTWFTPSKLDAEIRLDGRKVYCNNRLLYDFTLNVGDTFIVSDYADDSEEYDATFVLASIDSTLVDNEQRRRYNFKLKDPNFSYEWDKFTLIEGIGCAEYILQTLRTPFIHEEYIGPPELNKVYFKDKIIWERK